MSPFMTFCTVMAAYLLVFAEADGFPCRSWLGTQLDFLPVLMVYTGLKGSLSQVVGLALAGGLFFDSVSANPLGATLLPLAAIGLLVRWKRDVVLQDQTFAQLMLGFFSGMASPAFGLLTLFALRQDPLFGWGSLWQWFLMAAGCGLAAPLLFWMLGRLERAVSHPPLREMTYRMNREIKRGRF